MRAAKMKERPSFQLMVQTDVQSIYHMQMPRWLFSDPRYCEMSLDAKVTYTFGFGKKSKSDTDADLSPDAARTASGILH